MTDVIIAFLCGVATGGVIMLVAVLIFAHIVFKAAEEDEDLKRLERRP